ncbi:hypothetical protein CLV59_109140 [Chitinophaga dinghuensis]|uniref:Uncharacterized protein n=1 Tax=Chitinophaga dinghuensis TaxID=1539050 RepID=A0A327VP36_9BACT|nr:hypothetical protein [Chitinophaga dinghuensis]RAJ75526.1 hypothetical protein CLV59_109140 [Chitinophaga dinghuensis]
MSSVFGDFIGNVINQIKQGIPSQITVLQDFGQLEQFDPATGPKITLPCVLVDLKEFTWEDLSNNIQIGHGFLQVRIGIDPEVGTVAQYYELQQQVHQSLQGSSVGASSGLHRRSNNTEGRNNKYSVTVVRYEFTIRDTVTKKTSINVPSPVPVVNKM